MTIITRFSAALAPMLLVACVSGTDVFQVPPDAGPIECERPATPHVHKGYVSVAPPGTFSGPCLPPLAVSTEGLVDCHVWERSTSDCAMLSGRTHVRDEPDELGVVRQVCELAQVNEDGDVGWRYERAADFSPESEIVANCGLDGERLTLVGVALTADTLLEFACVVSALEYANGIGAACGTEVLDTWGACGYARGSEGQVEPLICDSATDRCVVPCTSDSDCADAGLTGEVCAERGVCVIPGCFAP